MSIPRPPSSLRALSCGGIVKTTPKKIYSMEIFRNSLKSLRILPVPSTTLHNGSSATHTGSPVSSRIRLSRFFRGTASGEHDAAVADIGGKLRRRAL